jgi:hypothetical protein
MKTKNPLYRKVNSRAGRSCHGGGDFKHDRNTKKFKNFGGSLAKMKLGKRHGLDYTPLYKFLLSKVGQPYEEVYKEAISRLDNPEPIKHIVRKQNDDGYVRVGESSWYSSLFEDDDGILRVVDPKINASNFKPMCNCCTHTFNGVVCTLPWTGTIAGTDE